MSGTPSGAVVPFKSSKAYVLGDSPEHDTQSRCPEPECAIDGSHCCATWKFWHTDRYCYVLRGPGPDRIGFSSIRSWNHLFHLYCKRALSDYGTIQRGSVFCGEYVAGIDRGGPVRPGSGASATHQPDTASAKIRQGWLPSASARSGPVEVRAIPCTSSPRQRETGTGW